MDQQIDRSGEYDQSAQHIHTPTEVCGTCGFDRRGHEANGIVTPEKRATGTVTLSYDRVMAMLERIEQLEKRNRELEGLLGRMSQSADELLNRGGALVNFTAIETVEKPASEEVYLWTAKDSVYRKCPSCSQASLTYGVKQNGEVKECCCRCQRIIRAVPEQAFEKGCKIVDRVFSEMTADVPAAA